MIKLDSDEGFRAHQRPILRIFQTVLPLENRMNPAMTNDAWFEEMVKKVCKSGQNESEERSTSSFVSRFKKSPSQKLRATVSQKKVYGQHVIILEVLMEWLAFVPLLVYNIYNSCILNLISRSISINIWSTVFHGGVWWVAPPWWRRESQHGFISSSA